MQLLDDFRWWWCVSVSVSVRVSMRVCILRQYSIMYEQNRWIFHVSHFFELTSFSNHSNTPAPLQYIWYTQYLLGDGPGSSVARLDAMETNRIGRDSVLPGRFWDFVFGLEIIKLIWQPCLEEWFEWLKLGQMNTGCVCVGERAFYWSHDWAFMAEW